MTSWTDYQDDISDAISDSMDVDWSASVGARAVVAWLNENKPLIADTPRVTVPPNVLESIAFNLCSLHDFDPAFVQQNEKFALATITEYLRAQPVADPAKAGAVTRWAQDSINKLCSGDAMLAAAPVREEGGAVLELIEAAKECVRLGRSTGEDTPENRKRCRAQYRLNQLTTPKNIIAALATREEAPAEAGEDDDGDIPWPDTRLSNALHKHFSELHGLDNEDASNEVHGVLEVIKALRAQPQAREEAQPVQCHHEAYQGYCAHCGVKIINGFAVKPRTPHAPEAEKLREWFADIKSAADSFRDCEGDEVAHQVIMRCDQALAALQQEGR
jgi:ferredoxin